MRKIILEFITVSLILYSIPCVSADVNQWIHVAFDQPVDWIRIHPKDSSLIYVKTMKEGIREGVFRTSDGGFSWQKVAFKKPDPSDPQKEYNSPLMWVALHPTDKNIIYGTADATGMFGILPVKSIDGGKSWIDIWQSMEWLFDIWEISRARYYTIEIDPNDPDIIYLGNSGIVISHDGGKSWRHPDKSMAGSDIWMFVVNPSNSDVYSVISSTRPSAYILKSSDKGINWDSVFGSEEGVVSTIAIDPTTGYLYAHGTNLRDRQRHTGMYKSKDGGKSWQSIDNGFPFVFDGMADYSHKISSLVIDPQNTNVIYAGMPIGIYRSVDAGESWQLFGLNEFNVLCIAVDPFDSSVYAGTNHGLFKLSSDNVTSVGSQGSISTTWGRIKGYR